MNTTVILSLRSVARPEATAPSRRSIRPPVNWSLIFIAVCGVLFAGSVSLRLNGSSSAYWIRDLRTPDAETGLLAGTPRLTRSDEWLFWTPAALAQLHHNPPMPMQNPALGAGAAPLLLSLPVRHYSMVFRPQLWGFFLFDAERGFAWFWATKIFGLLVSYFLLFRLLSSGRVLLSIMASVTVSYSSSVQWFFSSPTMLPEMLASWALMLVAGKSFFEPISRMKKVGAVLVLTGSAINFALSCYPPFQIPLVYLGLTLFSVFLWTRRAQLYHSGLAWLAGSLLLTVAALWQTFAAVRPTLEIIAHTSYPGARRGTGGGMSLLELFSGLLNFFDGQRPHLEMFPNISEASNFFPIWLAAIAGLVWRWWKKRGGTGAKSSPLHLALVAFILFFSLYAVVGLPDWLCRITALNFVTEKRALLAIGLAGLILTFVSLRYDGRALVSGWPRIWLPAIIAIATLAYYLPAQARNPAQLTTGYLAALLGVTTLLGSLYFCARPIVFAAALSGALLLNNFLVNPIGQGLPLLLRSPLAQRIAAIQNADPTAGWLVYERGVTAQFIIASGARVLNGVKAVPNLDLMAQLDGTGLSRDVYNRYALVSLGLPKEEGAAAKFEVVSGDCYRVYVSPFESAWQQAGLKYVVFPRPLDVTEKGPMKLIDVLPENHLWIYQVNGPPERVENEPVT
jgi:hypothetical protein